MNIWLLSFESIYVAKVGGLAEVPPRLGEALARRGHRVYVLTPGHGSTGKLGDGRELLRTRLSSGDHRVILYDKLPVPHIVFTGGALDEPEVYSPSRLMDKVGEWSILVKILLEKNGEIGLEAPTVIHGNDWHSVPALIAAKAVLEKPGDTRKTIYQIHLLSRTSLSLRQLADMLGIDIHVPLRGVYGWKTLQEYHALSHGHLDRLGALISDKTVTVSKMYERELVKRLGWDLEDHFDYIPNATTWSLQEVVEGVKKRHPSIPRNLDVFNREHRRILRRYLELQALGNVPMEEPVITDKEFKEFLEENAIDPVMPDGKTRGFSEEGPLIIMTGRLARQKGIHVVLKALGEIVFRVPEARLLLMLLPVWGERNLAEELIEAASLYRENLRVVFGKTPHIFYLAHVAGDVLVAPSIYEPFGLIALEGMITGNAVVASRTGGLAETVHDVKYWGVRGTGLHVEPGNHEDFAEKLSDMALFMETGYHEPWGGEWYRLADRISDNRLRNLLYSNPDSPWIIRRSAHRRALEYTWDRSAEKALKIYTGT